jgi:hypothetical protein
MLRSSARESSVVSRTNFIGLLFIAAMIIPLVSACKQSSDSVSVSTIQFSPDGQGWIQFKTNDTANYGYGYFEHYTASYGAVSEVTATVLKNSGSATAGFGVVFCFVDSNNFYRALVSEDGYYIVSQKTGGSYSTLQSWTQSPNVHTGYGVQNTIKVSYSTNLYSVFINDLTTPVFTFAPSQSNGTAGSAGFYAGIGSSASDNFPGTPADFRFKMTAPVAVP